jgi:hypothetical protein
MREASLTSPAGFAPRLVEADEVGAARCSPCSQNAHDETVLAREKSASWRAEGWEGGILLTAGDQLDHLLYGNTSKLGGSNGIRLAPRSALTARKTISP